MNWYKQGIREAPGRSWWDESQKIQHCCEASKKETESDEDEETMKEEFLVCVEKTPAGSEGKVAGRLPAGKKGV